VNELAGKPAVGTDAPPWRLARAIRAIVRPLTGVLYRTRVLGRGRIPSDRGAIIAGNHVSYLDPILIGVSLDRPIHYLAKAPLFEMAGLGWLLPRLWTIPVRQGSPDRQAIGAAARLLEADELIGIFPEGTRVRSGSPDQLGEAFGGVAFMALRAQVPIVPVGLAGTERIMPDGTYIPRFPRCAVYFGDPICPEDYAEGTRKERIKAMTDAAMQGIARAVEQARRV
jgi:1-acyl-sn-glycerol-3-phosphate acyltransferase